MKRLSVDKHKDKYVQIRDIYDKIKKDIKVKGVRKERQIGYKEFYSIISAYCEQMIDEVAVQRDRHILPHNMGKVYIEKRKHIRPFHLRIDREQSTDENIVWYKVPILDDYYNKVVWNRAQKYSRCKILPLVKFKKVINKIKEY
mgnify:FL=1|jgi:hypothetical protein